MNYCYRLCARWRTVFPSIPVPLRGRKDPSAAFEREQHLPGCLALWQVGHSISKVDAIRLVRTEPSYGHGFGTAKGGLAQSCQFARRNCCIGRTCRSRPVDPGGALHRHCLFFQAHS